ECHPASAEAAGGTFQAPPRGDAKDRRAAARPRAAKTEPVTVRFSRSVRSLRRPSSVWLGGSSARRSGLLVLRATMSAKGRKKQPKNNEEFFPTPEWCVDTIILSDLLKLPGGRWIEPCAGTGNIIKAVNRLRDDVDWIVCELQEMFHDRFLRPLLRPGRDILLPPGDYVHREWPFPTADVLIMNPPFSLTMQFVEVSFVRAHHVLCLQRKGFFGTQSRAAWLANYCPAD